MQKQKFIIFQKKQILVVKKGLKELINLIINNKVDTVYLTNKDRLLRFGT